MKTLVPVFLTKGPENITTSVGDNVQFTCEFQSLLDVNALWLHNDIVIDSGTIQTTSNKSTLYLSEVTLSQSGNYSCELDNGIIGKVQASAELVTGNFLLM